jgi:stalled ribosome alternative rescue factor ArfA
MNDNDIIKALECCRVGKGSYSCKKCPLFCRIPACQSHLAEAALDLINRKKAEIDKLEAAAQMDAEHIDRQNQEIEGLRELAECFGEITTYKRKMKHEAIKEFAKKLKGMSKYGTINVSSWQVDNLVKELTEEQHGMRI